MSATEKGLHIEQGVFVGAVGQHLQEMHEGVPVAIRGLSALDRNLATHLAAHGGNLDNTVGDKPGDKPRIVPHNHAKRPLKPGESPFPAKTTPGSQIR